MRRRLTLSILLIACAGCNVDLNAPIGVGADAGQYWNQKALTEAQAGKNEEALKHFTRAILSESSNPTLWSNRGSLYFHMNRFPEAYADFLKASSLNRTASVPRGVCGVDWTVDPAITAGAAAAVAANAAGLAAENAKNLPEAERWFRLALEADPSFHWGAWNLGRFCAASGRTEDARRCLDTWLDHDPRYAPYRAEWDLLLFRKDEACRKMGEEFQGGFHAECAGDWAEAFRRYARAHALIPPAGTTDGVEWWIQIASSLNRVRRRLAPPPPMPEEDRRLLIRAEAQVKGKQYAAAVDSYNQLVSACPWFPDAYSNRALLAAEMGQPGLAIAYMTVYTDLFPDAPDNRQAKDQIYTWQAKAPTKVNASRDWRPWFGIEFKDQDGAVRVTALVPDSPADRGGLRTGDVLSRIQGEPLPDTKALAEKLKTFEPGQEVSFTVKRGDREEVLKLVTGHRAVGAVPKSAP